MSGFMGRASPAPSDGSRPPVEMRQTGVQASGLCAAGLRLKRGGEEEWMSGEFDRLDSRIVRDGGHHDSSLLQGRGEAVGEAVGAPVKSLKRLEPQIDARCVPATGCTVRRSPYSEHPSGSITSEPPSGSLSAWAASLTPVHSRASSTVVGQI